MTTTEDTFKLRACPFCGGTNLRHMMTVDCRDCQTSGPLGKGYGVEGVRSAAQRWNVRDDHPLLKQGAQLVQTAEGLLGAEGESAEQTQWLIDAQSFEVDVAERTK